MGLRSPQELEQVQVGVNNLPSVSAAKTAAVDLATPANNFLQQKALNDQIESVKGTVALRKNALAKISSKYAVDSVTSEIKARMAALEGNNAIKESDSLYKEALRELDGIEDKAPEHLKAQVRSDKKGKVLELQTLMTNKMQTEGRKASIKSGEAITKMYTMEAASSFLDIDKFKEEYNNTYDFASNTERMKGSSDDDRVFSSGVIASNSVFKGVEFSLSQVATPDKVDEIEKYYKDVVLQDGDIHVNSADQTKINNAFTKAKDKTEGDMAYHLAAKMRGEVKEGRMTLAQAEEELFKQSGNEKVARGSYGLLIQQVKADGEAIKASDNTKFGAAIKAAEEGNPLKAATIIQEMSPTMRSKASEWMNKTEGGTANLYTDPETWQKIQKDFGANDQSILKVNPNIMLNAKDRRWVLNTQAIIGRQTQAKKEDIDTGAKGLTQAYAEAGKIATAKLAEDYTMDKQMQAKVQMNARVLWFDVVAKYPADVNPAVLVGEFNRLAKDPEQGILKDVTEVGTLGSIIKYIKPKAKLWDWFYDTKTEARPEEEFTPRKQTGGREKQVNPNEYDKDPMPSAAKINQLQDAYAKVGTKLTRGEAANLAKEFERRRKAKAKAK